MKPTRVRPDVKGSDASWALLIFVLLALLALAIVPALGSRRVSSLQRELRDVAEPARAQVTEIQLALAKGGAAARDLVDTGDPAFLPRYRDAAEDERKAYERLEPLVAKMDREAIAGYTELRRMEMAWDSNLDRLVRQGRDTQDPEERSRELDEYEATLLAAAQLDQTITRFADQTRARITRAERFTLTLTIGLVILAVAAALVVAHLARRLRHYARTAEQRRAALEDVMQSKARLMSGITHDLKNPLNVIDGHAQLMLQGLKGELTPVQKESVGKIRSSVASLLELIQTLLEMSRAESGHLRIDRKPIDLRSVVQDIVEQQRPAAEANGLVLDFAANGNIPTVTTDRARVTQIVGNLVSNAVKYTGQQKHGEVRVQLNLTPHGPSAGKWVAVTVADNGPGIAPEFRDHIFQEFARGNTRTEGAGLGLAISRRLARLLGGDITFQSEVGHGAEFTLWLPNT
jgi:signal transduction histidine kinase